MMNIIDIIDTIQDLPISEETLGAYIEGKLDDIEAENISSIIDKDLELTNIAYEVSQPIIDNNISFDDIMIDNLELPIINSNYSDDQSEEMVSCGSENNHDADELLFDDDYHDCTNSEDSNNANVDNNNFEE